MADIEILRYLATKTGLGLNYLSKDEKISIILEQQRDLFPEVVLKGGTVLSRVYLAKKGVSRFSEDIDLDFISDKGLNEKISTIKDRVKEIKGFDIEGPRILHRTLRFDCYYVNEFEQRDRVNLEFYLMQREARENAYYIGNSTNHFIPRNLRPDWKVFIDTLILKIERALGEVK